MVGKLDELMRVHEAALTIRGQRQQLLASNIANADTPNYKARDIDFASAMSDALQRNGSAAALAKTAPQHLQAKGGFDEYGNKLQYRDAVQGNVDGNTVDMDVERNQFAENSLRYEASLTIINMQIKNMLAAIQGQ